MFALLRLLFAKAELSVADLLPYAAMVAEGIVQLKSGAWLRAAWFRGPDTVAWSEAERAELSHAVNAVLRQAPLGLMLHMDAIRVPTASYPDPPDGGFGDPTSRAIDAERAATFQQRGTHYETLYALSLTYQPPSQTQQKLSELLITPAGDMAEAEDQQLAWFVSFSSTLLNGLAAVLGNVQPMTSEQLLGYLQTCLTGTIQPVALPPVPAYLDGVLGGQDLWSGFELRLGEREFALISIMGFPAASIPEQLAFLGQLPVALRWSTRFVFLDEVTAEKHISAYRKNWYMHRRTLKEPLYDATHLESESFANNFALSMVGDAGAALDKARSGEVLFGYYTSVIHLAHPDRSIVNAAAEQVAKELTIRGFPNRIETANAQEAWLGSLAGDGHNVRRPILSTKNLTDLLPLTATNTGHEQNPCGYYPDKSRALLYTTTGGQSIYRLNLHDGDYATTLVVGPPGAGKSTFASTVAAQFLGYPGCQVFCLDVGYSHYALTQAVGGKHFALASDDDTSLALCPLASAHHEHERLWLLSYLETLVHLEGLDLSPEQRRALTSALEQIGASELRSLTDLMIEAQDPAIQAALEPFTAGKPLGRLLDGKTDQFPAAQFLTFELSHLFELDEKYVAPVLLLLFHRITARLDGRPTLIIAEEFWISVFNSLFARMLEEWVRVARKRNAAVMFVTQSLADLGQMGRLDTLLRSCPTKIFLPNSQARHGERELYARLGLSDAEIAVISDMTPKRDYYIAQDRGGRQCFQLDVGPLALAFTGVDARDVKPRIDALMAEYGDTWPAAWLRERGCLHEAETWMSFYDERRQSK